MPRPFLPALALLAACGDNLASYDLYAHDPESFRTVTVWVDPHPDVSADVAVRACEAWRPEGVLCASAASSLDGLIRIHAYDGPCEENDDGTYPLGYATEGGDITLMIACLHRFGGTPVAEDALWPVVSHEVGHELGIWRHVPTDCADPEIMTHPEYGPVCGTALMNPLVHRGLLGITVIDHAAYELRDEDHSILRLAPEEGCIFLARDLPPP